MKQLLDVGMCLRCHAALSYLIFLSYYGAYVYVYRVSIEFSLLFIVYCLLYVKIVRNEYEYQDKFLIFVHVFGNKPFLILILTQ